jgi:hypothetical protein
MKRKRCTNIILASPRNMSVYRQANAEGKYGEALSLSPSRYDGIRIYGEKKGRPKRENQPSSQGKKFCPMRQTVVLRMGHTSNLGWCPTKTSCPSHRPKLPRQETRNLLTISTFSLEKRTDIVSRWSLAIRCRLGARRQAERQH